jgi:hypothetical protein
MSSTADLPDLNAWLALTWPAHIHHQHAVQYWEQQAAYQVLFCAVTALVLVRLVCQPKLMGTAVRNAAEASALLGALCQQPGVRLAKPEHNGWEVFHQLLRGGAIPGLGPCHRRLEGVRQLHRLMMGSCLQVESDLWRRPSRVSRARFSTRAWAPIRKSG